MLVLTHALHQFCFSLFSGDLQVFYAQLFLVLDLEQFLLLQLLSLFEKHCLQNIVHSDEVLKKPFPNNKFSLIYKRNKNLKEMVAPSLYPKPSIKSNRTIVSCKKGDICKNFLIADSTFRWTVTGKTYFIKGNMSCDSCNVIYWITFSSCREQYVGSAISFKQRFRIHKSDTKSNKDRCGIARHFNKCCSPNNKHAYLKV